MVAKIQVARVIVLSVDDRVELCGGSNRGHRPNHNNDRRFDGYTSPDFVKPAM